MGIRVWHFALSIAVLLVGDVLGANQTKRIGEIEFFGYDGIDLGKIRSALPLHEGDEINLDGGGVLIAQAQEALKRVTGHPPTDIQLTCCDSHNNLIVFIGISGEAVSYNPQPEGTARLPDEITRLYAKYMDAWNEAVQGGAAVEDWTKGYALSEYPPLRAIELEIRAYALDNAALLREVLRTAADDQQRVIAAAFLGYARHTQLQLAALARAALDPNSTVRNNALRALMVMAESNPEVAAQIPVSDFIKLLLSGTWTDLNKSSGVLAAVTKNRDPDVLKQLRQREVIERLIEMARWRTGHGQVAQYILGRIAGIDEERLDQLVQAAKAEVIIRKVREQVP